MNVNGFKLGCDDVKAWLCFLVLLKSSGELLDCTSSRMVFYVSTFGGFDDCGEVVSL
jgi:hypothetical protein